MTTIQEAVDIVASKFEYKSDPKSSYNLTDFWYIMEENENGKLAGDCEDFSLTAMYLHSGKSFWKVFWRLVVTGSYKMYYARTINGEAHCVGNAEGKWFDNWTLKAMDSKIDLERKTGHDIIEPFWRLEMAKFLLVGHLYKKFGWH